MKYAKGNKSALTGITFKMKKSEKIAVVGRTGAGKSSILQALFRMVEIEDISGSFIKLDEVNI